MSYAEVLRNYPERIMQGRKGIEANVLGCMMKDMLLIKEFEVSNKDFLSDEGKFYFDIITHLSKKNITEPTDTDIRLLCNDEVIKTYKEYGGFKRIEQLKGMVDTTNFVSYLDELYKKNLYISLYNDNIDLEKTIEIVSHNKVVNISYLDLFEDANFSSEEIVNFFQTRFSNKNVISYNKSVEEESGVIDKDFVRSLNEGSEMGVMFNYVGEDMLGNKISFMPTISNEVLGLKRSTINMIGAFVNVGKSTILVNYALSLINNGEKILLITNEQKVKDFKMAFLVYVASQILDEKSITKKKIKKGNFTEEELKILDEATEIYNELYGKHMVICSLPDSDIGMVEKLVRKYALGHGCTTLIYDTFKAEFNEKGEVSYKDLIRDSRFLEKLCKTYDLIGLCAIQLSQAYEGNLILDKSMLSNAKGINEVLTSLYMMRSVYNDLELDPENEKYFMNPYRKVKQSNGSWKNEKVDIDPKGTYRVMFITKTRDGQTFEDTQWAVLLHYSGAHGCFKEICLCKPQRRIVNEYSR